MQEVLTVGKIYKDNHRTLKLRRVNGNEGYERQVVSSKINRPGLELSGYWQYCDFTRIQIFGSKESRYLETLPEDFVRSTFKRLFSSGIPLVIFAHGNKPHPLAIEIASENKLAVMKTTMLTSNLTTQLMDYLDWHLAPTVIRHGSLVDVYGVGLLLTGRSGIGKSEVALDLVERGHRLVADDVIRIIRRADNVIIGTGLEFLDHHIEVRGLGIVDVRHVFGIRAIRQQKRIEVQVELVDWDNKEEYERIGSHDNTVDILGVPTPLIKLPIYPGKNITVIAEVIALNLILKYMGKNAAKELERRLMRRIREKTRSNELAKYLQKDFE